MSKELSNSASFKTYSLWLSPKKESQANVLLETLITTASQTFNSPKFQPHVTLLGSIETSAEEVVKKTQELVAKVKIAKIQMELEEIAVGDSYFQCVLWKVAKNSNTKALWEVNQYSREIFNKEEEPTFFPHLSLVYGEFTTGEKLSIRDRIIKEEFAKVNNERLHFDVDRITIVNTSGEPHEWQIIAELAFS